MIFRLKVVISIDLQKCEKSPQHRTCITLVWNCYVYGNRYVYSGCHPGLTGLKLSLHGLYDSVYKPPTSVQASLIPLGLTDGNYIWLVECLLIQYMCNFFCRHVINLYWNNVQKVVVSTLSCNTSNLQQRYWLSPPSTTVIVPFGFAFIELAFYLTSVTCVWC
jgi:hypothetical protein